MQIVVIRHHKGRTIAATPSKTGFWRSCVVGHKATFFDFHPFLVAAKAIAWIDQQEACA